MYTPRCMANVHKETSRLETRTTKVRRSGFGVRGGVTGFDMAAPQKAVDWPTLAAGCTRQKGLAKIGLTLLAQAMYGLTQGCVDVPNPANKPVSHQNQRHAV